MSTGDGGHCGKSSARPRDSHARLAPVLLHCSSSSSCCSLSVPSVDTSTTSTFLRSTLTQFFLTQFFRLCHSLPIGLLRFLVCIPLSRRPTRHFSLWLTQPRSLSISYSSSFNPSCSSCYSPDQNTIITHK